MQWNAQAYGGPRDHFEEVVQERVDAQLKEKYGDMPERWVGGGRGGDRASVTKPQIFNRGA